MYHYYKIADLMVKMDTFGRTADLAFPYRIEPSDHVDITIDPGYQIIKTLRPDADDDLCEYLASGRVFYRHLLDFDGIMLHASAVAVDGKAYLFSADSGTGKSTHVGLWRRLLGDERVRIINDDKPALRLENGTWYVYGTPWSGKYGLNHNLRCPLAGICFLERAPGNKIEPYTKSDLVFRFLKQTSRSKKAKIQEKTLSLIGNLLEKVPVWRLECNMELEAAVLSYSAMTGNDQL
jgi:hypothetical protein